MNDSDLDSSVFNNESTSTPPFVERLAVALKDATAARVRAERERDEDLRERKRVADAQIHDVIDRQYGDRVAALRASEAGARAAWEVAAGRAAEGKLANFPRGVVAEWARPKGHLWMRFNDEKKPTGRIGRYEIRVRESAFPANAGPWRLPNIGDVFIRVLKKDGSPSLNFEKVGGWGGDWRPQEESTP